MNNKIIVEENKYIEVLEGYVFANGGDGTLLYAINKFKHLKKPFYGKASGTVNYLMNKEDKPIEGSFVKSFSLIKATVYYMEDNLNKEIVVEAFNDIMIGGNMNSWINFKIEDKDELFGEFFGGGIIFSTPQGSTGINKNNNGSILPLSSNLWSITGDKTERKIEYVVEPRQITVIAKSRTNVTLWCDGINHVIDNVQKVVLESGGTVEVIFNNFKEFQQKRRKI